MKLPGFGKNCRIKDNNWCRFASPKNVVANNWISIWAVESSGLFDNFNFVFI